jgi:hypothetical protein
MERIREREEGRKRLKGEGMGKEAGRQTEGL